MVLELEDCFNVYTRAVWVIPDEQFEPNETAVDSFLLKEATLADNGEVPCRVKSSK
jgi:hypothetical protein